jgi:hypothetical protein
VVRVDRYFVVVEGACNGVGQEKGKERAGVKTVMQWWTVDYKSIAPSAQRDIYFARLKKY